ncbi:hypothetical protein KCP77_02205 [Salmonella enterica subsp. enterica]|nr:hypothetical protein KCP77_02205 [Salmonella enterica subsp. enterica]
MRLRRVLHCRRCRYHHGDARVALMPHKVPVWPMRWVGTLRGHNVDYGASHQRHSSWRRAHSGSGSSNLAPAGNWKRH